MTAILEVDGLTKAYDSFLLDHIGFSLQEGCITGFIGANGSGKTTTIKSLLGLIRRDAGRIAFWGKGADDRDPHWKNRIGVVFDEGYLYEELTLQDMKSAVAPAYSCWDEKVFRSYMSRFRLLPHQKIAALSKGMRMKFALALALSHHADLLIMDEPTSGLDPLVRSELMEILMEFMSESGKSVFFSTHITSDLDKTADMLILIDNGRIVLDEDKDGVLERHALVKGDRRQLNDGNRKLFLRLRETDYGFEGLTSDRDRTARCMEGIYMERPSVEDVMLAYIGRETP